MGVPFAWLLVFFLFPFLIILKISVSPLDEVSFQDLARLEDGVLTVAVNLGNYAAWKKDADARGHRTSTIVAIITDIRICMR